MTKEDFVVKLAQAGKVTKKQADDIFSKFVEMLAASLKKVSGLPFPDSGFSPWCRRRHGPAGTPLPVPYSRYRPVRR